MTLFRSIPRTVSARDVLSLIHICVDHIIGNNGMENGMKPEETVQKYVTLEEYSDSYK